MTSKPGLARRLFPVVAIGASAGGLQAFKKFLAAMPPDSGMAFVLIPHLDPTHESMMVDLLSKQTVMPVREAHHGEPLEPNQVFIIPPGKYLGVDNGILELSEPDEPRGLQRAIDYFFRSLAEDQLERSIGIVLSGTGSQGTLGLKEIKLVGGMIMAQEPLSAQYDQMPRNAIATGLVDYVLPPEDMPAVLIRYAQRAYDDLDHDATEQERSVTEELNRILSILRTRTKYDFRCYRKNMLLRRVRRRIGLLHLDSMKDYIARLRQDADEITALYKDLLIGVTAFFREPEAFRSLSEKVLPPLVDDATEENPIRVWVPACSTGEEAYTLGILLLEQFGARDRPPHFVIYATDIDEDSLEIARRGVYPANIADELSPKRLTKFFSKTDGQHYQVSKQLRECIVFAPQNLISDAPFSRLDLISCRNLLIYLEPEVQAKVISLLHFALKEGGHLLLGPSESIGRAIDLFEPVSKKWRLFRRIGPVRRDLLEIPIVAPGRRGPRILPIGPVRRPSAGFSELFHKVLVNRFAPASVLVNRKYEILSVQGPIVDYLEFPPGELTKDLMAMVRQGLRTRVRAACHKAIRDGNSVIEEGRVKRNNAYVPVSIEVQPLHEPREAEGLLVVSFRDHEGRLAAVESASPSADESSLVTQLEDELRSNREDLQSTIEELESSNEELKASNEEVMSMNEELQSANEELETSKEELQSMNEELSTVNSQLKDKVDELERVNNDIGNLMSSTDIATVFLDTDLCIKRFTPPTAKLLSLLATDIGRPINDFAPKFTDDSLIDDCRKVIDRLMPVEKEVRADDAYYLRRVLPYRTADNRIDGVVILFLDITQRVSAESQARRFATVLLDSNDAVTLQDLDGKITAWNRGAEMMYGYTEAEALQMNISDMVPADKKDEALDVVRRIARSNKLKSFETQRLTRDGRTIDVWMTVTRFDDDNGHLAGIATTERDITARRANEEKIRQLNQTLEKRVAERTGELQESEQTVRAILESAADAIITIDSHGLITTFNQAAERMFGYTGQEAIGRNVSMLMPPPHSDRHDAYMRRYQETGESRIMGKTREMTGLRRDGTVFPIALAINAIDHLGFYTGIIRDISERKALQSEILNIATREQSRIGQELHDGIQQELTGLGLIAQSLADALGQKSVPEVAVANKLAAGIATANRNVQLLARGLVPLPVDAEDLASALRLLAHDTSEITGVTCWFHCEKPVAVIDNLVATHLYRIAQEAVTNALRHAQADEIVISLEESDGFVRLDISDNGTGISDSEKPKKGLGLRIMHYRCALVGGELRVGQSEQGGTSVSCTVREP